jgi:hypothetical protein
MRKTVLISAALFGATAAFAQTGEITSNRGENWLSQDGDWGLTFDANPFLNYAGNLFNGQANNSIGNGLTWTGNNPGWAIQGKKLVDANTAYRGWLRIGFGSDKTTNFVDDASSTEPNVNVEDVTTVGNFNLVLGAGLEKRVGSTRVVGVYGAQLYVMLGSQDTTYEYGNALSNDNQQGGIPRVTESKVGSQFGVGLNAFAGVEWFCAPKVSIGGEYTWGLALMSQGATETTTEQWDAVDGAVETLTVEGTTSPVDKSSSFSLDTGVSGASISVNFYFQQ